MGVKVTFKDKGLAGLKAKIRGLEALSLTVGIQGIAAQRIVGKRVSRRFSAKQPRRKRGQPKAPAQRLALGTLALIHEFGNERIPARPFLRPAVFNNRESTAVKIAKEVDIYLRTKQRDALTTLGKIGIKVSSDVRARIENSAAFVPNDPDTVKAKGSSRPLHETGRLSRSLSWAVRGPGGSIISEGPAR